MAIALKAFAVPVGVLGSCCAAGIAIPLSVSSSASKGDLVGGGQSMETKELTQISLNMCSDSQGSENINFGDTNTQTACWKIEGGIESLQETEKTALSGLFSNKWKSTDTSSWGTGQSYKAQCVSSGSGWVLVNPAGSKEYLGFCPSSANSSVSQQSFLEVDKPSAENVTLKLCANHCWTDSVSEVLQSLQTPNVANWKEVKFFSISQ